MGVEKWQAVDQPPSTDRSTAGNVRSLVIGTLSEHGEASSSSGTRPGMQRDGVRS